MLASRFAIVLVVLNLIFSVVCSINAAMAPTPELIPESDLAPSPESIPVLDSSKCSAHKVGATCGVWDSESRQCKKGVYDEVYDMCTWHRPGLYVTSQVGMLCSSVNCVCFLLILFVVITKK